MNQATRQLALFIGTVSLFLLFTMLAETLLAAPSAQSVATAAVTPNINGFPLAAHGDLRQVVATPTPTATGTITSTTPTPIPTLLVPAGGELQSTVNTDWTAPFNLSRSGATTDPQILVDSSDRFHALWRDTIDGFAYAIGDGVVWSDSVLIEAPFATRRYFPDLLPDASLPRFTPRLVADSRGNIHAFWVDNSDPAQSVLYHSQVPAGQFNNIDAWSVRQPLDTGTLDAVPSADASGRVHLVYLRTIEDSGRQAGVYYQTLRTDGNWSGPRGVYGSRYMRATSPDAANVQIAVGDDQSILIAWDDAGREQVLVARSSDGGQSWSPPMEIDRRAVEDSRDAPGPSGISVGMVPGAAMSAVVTWGAGHEPGRECTQYYRSYSISDGTWTSPQSIDELPACLDSAQLMFHNGILYLFGTIGGVTGAGQSEVATAYLMAWNGERWSVPQIQSQVRTFVNLDTNQPIELGCHETLIHNDRLHLIGCDQDTGNDIWASSRAMGDVAAWFPPPSTWQGPEQVASSETPPLDLQLVADSSGITHSFWFEGNSSEISHMFWNGQAWSSAFPIIVAPEGNVEEIAVASYADRLYLIGRDRAGLFYSAASITQPTQWSVPVRIETGQPEAVAPFLMADNSGLLLTFAVPLNEERGVYVLRSVDEGRIWSEPQLAFDGTAAGWPMVDQPQIAKTEGGEIHLIWLRSSLPPDASPLAIFYSRSSDSGFTWSEAQEVVNTPVVWNRLFGEGDRVLHRLWVEPANERNLVWHAMSIDDGLTWGENAQITALDEGELPAATIDAVGQVHVLSINNGQLVDLVLTAEGWQSAESLTTALADGGLLSAAADTAGRLTTLYAGQLPGVSSDETGTDFFAAWRPLAPAIEALPVPPTLTPTPPSTATPQPDSTAQPTPTIVIPTNAVDGPLSRIPGLNSEAGSLILAIVPAGLVVLLVSIIGFRAMRMRRP